MRTAGQFYRLKRRRFFERKARAALPAPDDPPSKSATLVMRQIDGLSHDVRDLVYEYGLMMVAEFFNRGLRGVMLRAALEQLRRERQEHWLSTNMGA